MRTIIRASSTQFARPGDTNAYADGDIIANSTTNTAVVPLQFDMRCRMDQKIQIDQCWMRKSTSGATNPNFRLNLFKATVSVATAGDNAAFTNVTGATNFLGSLTLGGGLTLFADGAAGILIPFSNASPIPQPLIVDFAGFSSGVPIIFGLLEAKAAYAPGNAETFDFTLYARTLD